MKSWLKIIGLYLLAFGILIASGISIWRITVNDLGMDIHYLKYFLAAIFLAESIPLWGSLVILVFLYRRGRHDGV